MSARNTVPTDQALSRAIQDYQLRLRKLESRYATASLVGSMRDDLGAEISALQTDLSNLEAQVNAIESNLARDETLAAGRYFDFVTGFAGDTTAAAYATWSPVVAITPPSIATLALCQVIVTQVTPISAAVNVNFRIGLGAARTIAWQEASSAAGNDRVISASLQLSGFTAGSPQNLILEAQRNSGTGAFRAALTSRYCWQIEFT